MKRYIIAGCVAAALLVAYAATAEIVRVPAISGTYGSASARLLAAGLRVNVEDRVGLSGDLLDRELVVSQDPGGGSLRASGTTVTVVTRPPRNRAIVPNVVGLHVPDAEKAMLDAGLVLAPEVFPEGSTVASTAPAAGVDVSYGSVVVCTLKLVH